MPVIITPGNLRPVPLALTQTCNANALSGGIPLLVTRIFICPRLSGIVVPPKRRASYVPRHISGFDLRSAVGNWSFSST